MSKPLHENPELSVIDRIKTWFGRISFGLIMVSCGDVMLVLWHYIPANASAGEKVARWLLLTMLSIGLIVGIVWAGRYIELQRRAKQPVGVIAWLGFWVCLGFEFTVNTGALWSALPAATVMPRVLAQAIAIFVGLLISLSIYNTGVSSNSLERTRRYLIAVDMAEAEKKRKQDEAEAERKAKAEHEEEERREDLRRKNEDRRARRQLTGPSTIPENRRLPQVDEDDKYQPNAVNVASRMVVMVDEKPKAVDARAVGWLTLNVDNKMSAQAISDHLGGRPSKAYISLHIKLYREWLAVHATAE